MKTYYIATPLPIESFIPEIESLTQSKIKTHIDNNQVGILKSHMSEGELQHTLYNADIEIAIINDELNEWL